MTTLEHAIFDILSPSNPWVYLAILIMAIAESFIVTSFVISGTIGFVAVGVLVQQGHLHGAAAVLAIYAGTLLGDLLSFALSAWLQRFGFVRALLARMDAVRDPLSRRPFRFIVVGHFTPYIRAALPLLAAGALTMRRYVAIDLVAAACSTSLFVGAGYSGALLVGSLDGAGVTTAVGLVALVLIVALWIGARSCPLRRPVRDNKFVFNTLRALCFFLWFPVWHPARYIENALRRLPTRRLRNDLAAAFPDVQPGDIFLVRLHMPAPWGVWAHSAIAIDSHRFAHGFGKVISAHRIEALPVRFAIAHLRVRCRSSLAATAGAAAEARIGIRVSIGAPRADSAQFSCASLVARCYQDAGVELVPATVDRVVPDDLLASKHVELIRVVYTERVARQQGDVAASGLRSHA
ncbi:hypothetical protein [Vitreimonas sp.]|uniref:DedA family protein n=1 Tax=Vitreimonas sp. TaxID=3069702 RepID=UPI002ED800D7